MVGKGSEKLGIEVTTFRGDGTYTDSRRPDSVIFGVSLEEDLARRDFVINAMAFDPISGTLEDPFGGAADIEARMIRAVGDPATRFDEDGLRVMRAVRFVSVLDFELDAATEAALTGALGAFAKVASERVRVELLKLLGGTGLERALEVAHHRGVLGVAVPLTAEIDWTASLARVLATPADPVLRLASLLLGLDAKPIDAALRALTMSNEERARVNALCGTAMPNPDVSDAALRQLLGSVGRKRGADLVSLWAASAAAELAARTSAILATGNALTVSELAIRGKDVMAILEIEPSRRIGEILAQALAHVHEHPSANTRNALTAFIKGL